MHGAAVLRAAGFAGTYVAGIVTGAGVYVISKERELPPPPSVAFAQARQPTAKVPMVAAIQAEVTVLPEPTAASKVQTAEQEQEASRAAAGGDGDPASIARCKRKLLKLQRASQEHLHWAALDCDMLGLQPRLWLEVFDKEHRYATLLYDYWKRWQLSDTRDPFHSWLNQGLGSMIDLPYAPRRLLDEWRVIYLTREQRTLFQVRIDKKSGRFVWVADGTPVNLPTAPFREKRAHPTSSSGVVLCDDGADDGLEAVPTTSKRELQVSQLLRPVLSTGCRRDLLLERALDQATMAWEQGEKPRPELLAEIAAPLVKEGLLCQLRDPLYAERLDASTTHGGHDFLLEMPQLPTELLPELEWDDMIRAIKSDQGRYMQDPFPSGAARAEGDGIFVIDTHGTLYCGTKIHGVFHHSSFVRGHAVQVAGGLTIVDGRLQELSPQSEHYLPSQDHISRMMKNWTQAGVDFSQVDVLA